MDWFSFWYGVVATVAVSALSIVTAAALAAFARKVK